MRFFGRKHSGEPAAAPRLVPDVVVTRSHDVGRSTESQQFYKAAQRGNLDEASALIDRHLASGGRVGAPNSLLDRAAAISQDLREGRLDDAASALGAWGVPYGSMSTGNMLSPEQQASIRALGLSLMNYFAHPDSHQHHRYDDLMDGKLAEVAKSSRLARDPFFDSVYARIKSQREINRAR